MRLFDEEIDGLGFQLKEWPWHWGREQFLADLCANRKIAVRRARCGWPATSSTSAPQLAALRRALTPYEQAACWPSGQIVAHALEATCRTLQRDETEREVAGQLAHRLIHRGVLPVHVGVAADGRSRHYRRHGFTAAPVSRHAVLTATGRKYGLHATAARTVCFGEPPDDLRAEVNAVCRVTAGYVAATWPDAVPREVLLAGRRIYLLSGHEHEWLLAPQGHVTGPAGGRGAVHAAPRSCCSRLGGGVAGHGRGGGQLPTRSWSREEGARPVTPTEIWPLKRIRIQGAEWFGRTCWCADAGRRATTTCWSRAAGGVAATGRGANTAPATSSGWSGPSRRSSASSTC